MSAWRRKSIAMFPDLRREIEHPDTTIYTLFFDLLPRCREAHVRGDEGELKDIYGFADWCAHQTSKELSNAAGVAFYEHIVEFGQARRELAKWVKPEVFRDILELLKLRLDADAIDELEKQYRR